MEALYCYIQAATLTLFTTCHSGRTASCFFLRIGGHRLIHNGLDFQLVVTHHTFCLKNVFLSEKLKINYSI